MTGYCAVEVAGETMFDGLHELGTTAAVLVSLRWARVFLLNNRVCGVSSKWNHDAGPSLTAPQTGSNGSHP